MWYRRCQHCVDLGSNPASNIYLLCVLLGHPFLLSVPQATFLVVEPTWHLGRVSFYLGSWIKTIPMKSLVQSKICCISYLRLCFMCYDCLKVDKSSSLMAPTREWCLLPQILPPLIWDSLVSDPIAVALPRNGDEASLQWLNASIMPWSWCGRLSDNCYVRYIAQTLLEIPYHHRYKVLESWCHPPPPTLSQGASTKLSPPTQTPGRGRVRT